MTDLFTPVLAAGKVLGDAPTKFKEWCVAIANESTPIVMGILVIIILIIGISLAVSKKARQNAIEWIPWVAVGAGVALGAVTIATAIGKSVAF